MSTSCMAQNSGVLWILCFQDDKDIMRLSLDVEAQRYFEDCVSIEKLESLGVDCLMVSQERDVLSTENEEPFNWPVETDSDSVLCHADRQEVPQRPEHWRKSSSQNYGESLLVGKAAGKTKDCVPLDDEGMCLPWLEWEPEVDTLNRKEQVERVSCFNHFFIFGCILITLLELGPQAVLVGKLCFQVKLICFSGIRDHISFRQAECCCRTHCSQWGPFALTASPDYFAGCSRLDRVEEGMGLEVSEVGQKCEARKR